METDSARTGFTCSGRMIILRRIVFLRKMNDNQSGFFLLQNHICNSDNYNNCSDNEHGVVS